MFQRARARLFCMLLALVAGLAPAGAASFFSNSSGLASPATVVTFDEAQPPLAPGTIISQADNPYDALGFAFFVAVHQPIAGIFDGGYVGNFLATPTLQIAQNFVIFFDTPQNRVAFKLYTGPHTTAFEAYLGTTLVELALIDTGPDTDVYFGFDGIVFDAIQITPNYEGSRAGALLDNLQFGTAVPEPASWVMLLVGFGASGLMLRRRNRQLMPAQPSTVR